MMCKAAGKEQQEQHPNDNMWLFELPKYLPSEAYDGDLDFSDVSIIFLQNKRHIISATYHGRNIDPDDNQINLILCWWPVNARGRHSLLL